MEGFVAGKGFKQICQRASRNIGIISPNVTRPIKGAGSGDPIQFSRLGAKQKISIAGELKDPPNWKETRALRVIWQCFWTGDFVSHPLPIPHTGLNCLS
jgi:hypothetical protein